MEILSYTFAQYAFLSGFLVALLSGVVGPMVVSSKQSVTSDMLSHTALAGIGFAAVFGFLPLWGAFAVLIFAAVLLWVLTIKNDYSSDALAMLFMSGGLALALALVHIARSQAVSFESYLFGSILTVTVSELILMSVLTIVSLGVVYSFWYPLLGVVQSPAYRVPYSKRPEFLQLVFFIILALTVWVGLKTVGGLLIGALLVIPVLAARPFVHSFRALTLFSTVISLFGVFVGLFLSFLIDVPPSSLMIGMLVVIFGGSIVLKKLS